MFAVTDYGPFGPVVGYGAAIIAAVSALSLTWQGRLAKWKPPEEDLPNVAQKVVLMLCGVGMVVVWYFAEPKTVPILLFVGVALGLVCFGSFLIYSGMIGRYSFVKQVAVSPKKTPDVKILGGRDLLPSAVQTMKKNGITSVQDLFEGAAYDPDKLWSRESRQWVKTRIVALFVVVLFSGTLALTAIGFVTQVALTGKPVATIIRTSDAPVRQEIVEFLARLNEELKKFEDTMRQKAANATEVNTTSEINNALLAAVKHAQNEIEQFKAGRRLNGSEQSVLNDALSRFEERRHLLENQRQLGFTDNSRELPEESKKIPSATSGRSPDKGVVITETGAQWRFAGVASSLVVVHNGLDETQKVTLSEAIKTTSNSKTSLSFVKAQQRINPNDGYIAYVGADGADGIDMAECAKFTQRRLNEIEAGLGTSLPIKEIQSNQRPQTPEGIDSRYTVWVYLPR